MRTIEGIRPELIRLEEAINKLVQNSFYGHDLTAVECKIVSLPVKMRGLGLIIPSEIADSQYQSSKLITSPLSNAIIEQRKFTVEDKSEIKKRRKEVKCNVEHSHQLKLDELKCMLSEEKV